MVDSADGWTPETGISPVVKITKGDGTTATPTGAVTEVDSANNPGLYQTAGNATDTNTLGPLNLIATGTGCRNAYVDYEVVSFDPQDVVRLGLTAMPNVVSGNAGAIITAGTGTAQLSVTSGVGKANTVQISDDATAADNFETMLDGTGGQQLTLGKLHIENGSGVGVYINGSTAGITVEGDSAHAVALSGSNKGLLINCSTGNAVEIASSGGNGDAVQLTPHGTGKAINAVGPVTASGTVTLNALTVSNATTLTGAVTASNASNNIVGIDIAKISGDSAAADNLERWFDGTVGFSTSGAAMNLIQLNVINPSGTAAYFDGTGGPALTLINNNGEALYVASFGGDGSAARLIPNGTGKAISAEGPVTITGATTLAAVGMTTLTTSGTTTFNALTVTNATTLSGAVTATHASNDIRGVLLTGTQTFNNTGTWTGNLTGTVGTVNALAANSITATAVDASAATEIGTAANVAVTAAHGIGAYDGSGSSGGGAGAYAVTATVHDQDGAVVQNASVSIFEGVTTQAGITNSSGTVTWSANAGSYTVSATKSGYTHTPETRSVTGTQAGTLVSSPIVMTQVVIPPAPDDPRLCNVYGYLENIDGSPAVDVAITFELVAPEPTASERLLSGRTITVRTDKFGQIVNASGLPYVGLQRNDLLDPAGTTYLVTCAHLNLDSESITLDTPTFDLLTVV